MAIDGDGEYLHFGSKLSPRLSPEQKNEVVGYLAEGKKMQETADLVGCSFGRVRQVRDDIRSAESIQRERTNRVLPGKMDQLGEILIGLKADLRGLRTEISQMRQKQQMMNMALYRRQLELKKSREAERTAKEDRKRLRRELHRLTGDHGYRD